MDCMSTDTNRESSREWHQAFGTPNLRSAYDKFLADDFKALFFGFGWVDRDAYIAGDQEFATAFENVRMTVEETAAEGDLVFCRMRWRGTHIGDVLGIPASGKDFDVVGFCQDRYRDGKVVEHIPLFDTASLQQQLTGEPPESA